MADVSGTIESGQDSLNTVISDYWPNLNVDSQYFDVTECASNLGGKSLAEFVLDQFGVLYIGTAGGTLDNIDIKRMDAMTVINQSLMEELTKGYLVEPIVNADGKVEFVQIGSPGGNISDIYYTVQTKTLTDTAKGVMITGKRPLPLKRAMEWKPIWGEGEDSSYHLYAYEDMLANCNLKNFTRYATIVFNDPHLDTKYADGLDNLFDITNPWETMMGYVHYKKIPKDLVEGNTEYSIDYTNSATVPIPIPALEGGVVTGPSVIVEKMADMGLKLATYPQYDVDAGPDECWSDPNQGVPVDWQDGVAIPIRTEEYSDLIYDDVRGYQVDKFVRVSGVYVIGVEVDYIRTSPASDADAEAANKGEEHAYQTWVSIEDKQRKTLKLTEGTHYGIAYNEQEQGFKTPYIVFVKDVRSSDPQPYGTNTTFYLYQGCKLARELPPSTSTEPYTAAILPIEKNRGILVEEIWAVVDLDTPSIVVQDPQGGAKEIASQMNYYLGMMKMYRPPAPIGYAGDSVQAGKVVDQTTGVQDNDPTTALDTEQTSEIEAYYDEMQGGGMALTLAFLDETQVASVAATLYKKMNWSGTSTVHTCGPCADPQLGKCGTTGVINSIQYSYSDKGSYTISVEEGPYIVGGLTPVDGGPTQKAAEDVSFSGRIIKDAGNSVHFKVSLDGYGERWAMSTTPQVLRVGDVVNCTVHNNPVEA